MSQWKKLLASLSVGQRLALVLTAIAVAGGLEKTAAIRACLQGRYFNVLITDAYVAEALLQGD